MQVTLRATGIVDTVAGKVPARIWEGTTAEGVPVKAWIAVIQPQTDDPALLEQFGAELREVPATRELVSFDVRML